MTACTRSALAMLTDFFASNDIEATARRTGFVKRASKITGKLFLALVTFGSWSDAQTTLAQLAAKVPQVVEQGGGAVDVQRGAVLLCQLGDGNVLTVEDAVVVLEVVHDCLRGPPRRGVRK